MSRETECFSIYSDISRRIIACSSPYTASASARHSSVLPTPVGPRNRKLPTGRAGSLSPTLPRRTALATVSTAQITYAARDSDFDGFAIHQGDYLALRDGKLFGTDPDENALLRALAEDAAKSDPSFLSLYYGEDVTEEQAAEASAIFRTACPGAELSVLSGGQPVYYYIISVE